jgi:hypothetical protein
MNIQTFIPLLVAIAVLIAAVLVIWFAISRMRSLRLKKKFGPEYDYALDKLGDRRTAEADLKEREDRVVKLDIHTLTDKEQNRYQHEWLEIQAQFVDDPPKSVEKANLMITEIMIARGFPVADFEQRTADLSVIYPDLVPHYRQANSLAQKNRDGATSTEELRQAMIEFRYLFSELAGIEHVQEKQMEAAL